MEKKELKVGDVVQINPDHDEIFGAHFMIVTEPKSWGAQGYCLGFPYKNENGERIERGLVFYRCAFENMEFIGHAEWVNASSISDNL